MQQLVSSLEGSSYINFNNEHINCSCCSNDFFYNTLKSNVTRSSTDYFPDIPQSHGNHIFTNAHTAFWIGEVTLPDWDMFQSGNTAGEFHAMSKAISGGPVYFTDEIGMQKKEIINKLSTKDGRIGLCTDHARMTLDSMFIDPKKDYIPVKIFNYNKYGFVVGAFNCCYDKNEKIMVSTSVSPSDVYGIKGEIFYAYSNNNGGLGKIQKEATTKVSLNEFEGDIITFSPIANGFAVVGMVEKYNPLGFIKGISYKNNILKIEMLESGKVLIYSERNPKKASEDFSYSNNLIYVNSKSNKFWVEFGE
jgi:raffinose synthase